MSGRDKFAEKQQRQLAMQQQQAFQDQLNLSKQRLGRMDEIQAPSLKFYQNLASGDQNLINSALAVPMQQLQQSQRATEAQIMNTVPEGPLRDFLLMSTKRDQNSNLFNLRNQAVMSSYDKLLDIGGMQGQVGLQQLGASSRFGEAAATSNQALINAAAQRKAATMGALGQAAGAAGMIFSGGFGGARGASGGSGRAWV